MYASGVFKERGVKRRDVGNRERKHSVGIDPCPLAGDAVRILNLIASCLQCATERAVSHTRAGAQGGDYCIVMNRRC